MRIALASSKIDTRSAVEYCAKSTKYTEGKRAWGYTPPPDYVFEKRLPLFQYEEAVAIVREHTVEPVLRHTMHLELAHELACSISSCCHLPRGADGASLFAQQILRGWPVLFCGDCFQEQVETIGFTYFRLEWQLPYAKTCSKHLIPLSKPICDGCQQPAGFLGAIRGTSHRYCAHCRSNNWSRPTSPYHAQSAAAEIWYRNLFSADLPAMSKQLRLKAISASWSRLWGTFGTREDRRQFYHQEMDGAPSEIRRRRMLEKPPSIPDNYYRVPRKRRFINQQDPLYHWSHIREGFKTVAEFRKWLGLNAKTRCIELPRTKKSILVLDV